MQKEYVPTVSYINSDDSYEIKKEFVFSKPKSFSQIKQLRNTLIQKLFSISNGTIFISNFGKLYGIRRLIELMKNDGTIVKHGEGPIFSDYPKFNYFGIYYKASGFKTEETQRTWGYCFLEEDTELALSKALGECLERESSYYLPGVSNIQYPFIKNGDATFLYPLIPKAAESQKRMHTSLVTSPTDLKNVCGFFTNSLTGDSKRFFPLETFYWGRVETHRKKVIHHPTSNGCGAGTSTELATLSAINELIERDHFLLYWFSGIQPNKIENASLPIEFREYIHECEETYNLEVHFLDLRYDTGILTAVCIIIDPVLHIITMGAKVGVRAEHVLRFAFLEALAVLSSTRNRNGTLPAEELRKKLLQPPFSESIGRRGRIDMYNSQYGISIIKKSFLQGEKISFEEFQKDGQVFDSPKEELVYLIEKLKKLVSEKGPGYHAYIHEFNSKWLKKLSYYAVRVYIPSFLKLHLSETLATPMSDRLVEFAKSKGKEIKSEADINPLPHFFP